jgi:hypothetical protein
MDSLPQIATGDEFNPTPEDRAWAAAAFGDHAAPAVPDNGRPATLAEFVDHEARAYRAQGTREAAFLASHLERLAQLVRWTAAATPEEHEARMEVWDDSLREQWFDRGYAEGLEAAKRELAPYFPDRPC